jgi:hypothetical protein
LASSWYFIFAVIEVFCGPLFLGRHAGQFSYAKFYSRSHDAVIRVYDEAGNLIEAHKHAGDFRES